MTEEQRKQLSTAYTNICTAANNLSVLLLEVTKGTDIEKVLEVSNRPLKEMAIGRKIKLAKILLGDKE